MTVDGGLRSLIPMLVVSVVWTNKWEQQVYFKIKQVATSERRKLFLFCLTEESIVWANPDHWLLSIKIINIIIVVPFFKKNIYILATKCLTLTSHHHLHYAPNDPCKQFNIPIRLTWTNKLKTCCVQQTSKWRHDVRVRVITVFGLAHCEGMCHSILWIHTLFPCTLDTILKPHDHDHTAVLQTPFGHGLVSTHAIDKFVIWPRATVNVAIVKLSNVKSLPFDLVCSVQTREAYFQNCDWSVIFKEECQIAGIAASGFLWFVMFIMSLWFPFSMESVHWLHWLMKIKPAMYHQRFASLHKSH